MTPSRPLLLIAGIVFTARVAAMQLTLTPTNATCGYASGSISINLTGGEAPYTFAWADGPTTANREGLLPGIYSLTVTDALSDQVTEEVEIFTGSYNFVLDQPYAYCNAGGQMFPFDGMLPTGAVGPWYVDGQLLLPAPGFGGWGDTIYAFYPSSQTYSYSIVDGNGCSGTISGTMGPQITDWPTLTVTGVDPSCVNENIGAIHLLSSGPDPADMFTMLNLVDENGALLPYTTGVDPSTLEAHFGSLPPGTYGIHWWMGVTLGNLDPGECDWDTTWVTIPNIGNACGAVDGISWYDANGDCVHDANEVGIPLSPLELQPGGEVVLTGMNGGFYLPLYNGDYSLAQMDPTLIPICPVVQPIPFTVNSDVTVLELANGSTLPLDLQASITSGAARPGFSTSISAWARNLSAQVSGPVTFTVTLDPVVVYQNAIPAPTFQAGNTLTWELPAFNSFGLTGMSISALVPVGTALGTVLQHTATVTNTLPEGNLTNNTGVRNVEVTGSVDPNDKTVQTSSGYSNTQYFIGTDQWLDYVIRFQNTGTDTAFTVVVTDTLPAELDMLTYQQGPASHGFDVSFHPGRVVSWTFPNILLPDSNTNETASHGLVSFRIRPHEPLLPGTVISNNADIFFDFNTAVRTNDADVVAEMSTGISTTQGEPCRAVVNGDQLMVFAIGEAFKATTVRLVSMDGRTVLSHGTATIDRNGMALNIAALQSGSYLLWLHGADGRVWNQRFVKL